jgi:hypothetical protein
MTDTLTRLGQFEDTLISSIHRHHRRTRRRRATFAVAGLSVLLAGSAVAATQLPGGDVSAARDTSLPEPPAQILDQFRSLGAGSIPGSTVPASVPGDARDLGNGIYVQTRPGNILCVYVAQGMAQCGDANLNGQDAWVMSDIVRESGETSPFDMHVYGIAKDGVTAIALTTDHGVVTVPVSHNAFRDTVPATSFADVSAIHIEHADGSESVYDPKGS